MKRFVSALFLSVAALLAATFAMAAVDINTANESQLETLPGIGPGKAKAIVAERQANGPFKSVDDLGRVKGIGDKTIAQLREQASVGAPATTGTAGAGRDSPGPAGGIPWGWVVAALLAAGVIGWFLLRRRSTGSTTAATPGQAPIAPTPAPAPPTPATSGPAPRPAGPGPGLAAGAKAPSAAASGPPHAPAGPKPAGQPAPAAHPTAPAGPPPAPAGPKRKGT
ncbi:MAG: ComEA family DNA-binding protein [Sterolibacteriaceae bacterium]|nr:ComEA family DNA-binding protein [Candidatus Methylophosphatis haderslevensis]